MQTRWEHAVLKTDKNWTVESLNYLKNKFSVRVFCLFVCLQLADCFEQSRYPADVHSRNPACCVGSMLVTSL